jgi:hypothetical protein
MIFFDTADRQSEFRIYFLRTICIQFAAVLTSAELISKRKFFPLAFSIPIVLLHHLDAIRPSTVLYRLDAFIQMSRLGINEPDTGGEVNEKMMNTKKNSSRAVQIQNQGKGRIQFLQREQEVGPSHPQNFCN